MTSTLSCTSPIDGSLFAERPAMALEEARAAAARLRKAQASWAARPLEERAALVCEGARRFQAMDAESVPELARMMGRPVRYGGESAGVVERADYMAGVAAEALAPLVIETSPAHERRILREPFGSVLIIAPWNYPYLTVINTLAPALIAGNTVALKHAAQTLLAGERIVRAFHEAGVPEEVLANLFLAHETTEALLNERAFDCVNFTGSVAGGRAVEAAALGTFVPVGLELGGKDPGYVMEDADVHAAAEGLMDAAVFNAGQCCCAMERLYIHESLYEPFLEAAVKAVCALKLGDPLRQETTLGPMAHIRFASEVRAQVAEAEAAGARLLIEPHLFPADDGTSAYVMPQILTNVSHEMRIMRDETFGPVIGVMKVRSDEEALALMNDSDYGLTASLWTKDPERAARLGAEIQTGTVFMNRADFLDPALCWTGCKNTGRGGSLSSLGYLNLTRPKSYHLRKHLS